MADNAKAWVVVMLGSGEGGVTRIYHASGCDRSEADRMAEEKNRRYSRQRGLVFEVRRKGEERGGERDT